MTTRSADALLDRLANDHDFAVEIRQLADEPTALAAFLAAEGFDVTDEDVRETFVARYGDQLSAEQLDAVSGGIADALLGILLIVVPTIIGTITGTAAGVVGGVAAHNATR